MGYRRAEVDERAVGTGCKPLGQEIFAGFQLECRRHTVMSLVLVGCVRLTVGMEIDEARCNHQAGDIDDFSTRKRLVGDLDDAVTTNADIANGVEPGLGIDDSPTVEDDVVVVGGLRVTPRASPKRQRCA